MKPRPALSALVLVAATTPLAYSLAPDAFRAVAAEELCFGQVPTIVGVDEEQQVVGTDGPDVVIAHGGEINTGDGDDLVCVVGAPENGQPPGTLIYAGSGNDRVDNSRSGYDYLTYLGDGADEYVGGPAREYVSAFQDSQSSGPFGDHDVDVIVTAGAGDWVFSGGGSDVVDLGPGRDDLFLRGLPADGVIAGGPRSDFLHLWIVDPEPHSWTIDNRGERLLRDGQLIGGWDSFNWFEADVRGGPMTFLGSDRDEGLAVPRPQWPLDVRMGGGDDKVELVRGAPADHHVSGGKGTDKFSYGPGYRQGYGQLPRDIYLDLSSGVLRDARQPNGVPTSLRAVNFESAQVQNLEGGLTVMKGTSGPNVLRTVTAGATMYGMAGDDVMVGDWGDDVLMGGTGHDEAYGWDGIDQCEAEERQACER